MAERGRERERFQRAAELFQQALNRPRGRRDPFVRDAARGDNALVEEVLAMLAEHQGDASLPELPTRVDASTVSAPERVGHYRIVEKVAEGGMGSVYVAEQREPMRRRVALKLLKPGLDSREVIVRFEAERQALALMDHPNIAKVFEGGVAEDGRPFFAMEYVPGEPITGYCDRHRLSLRDRLRLVVTVCEAVQHAHQKGIIHRDLKPSNVLVTAGDGAASPKVIDFGIAKAVSAKLTKETLFTAHGLLIGTPEYMSPEQAQAGATDIDTRSDVYSLGVLLYELLVGRLPFDRDVLRKGGISEALRVLREDEPPRPSSRLRSLGGNERGTVVRERRSSEAEIRRELGRDLDWVVLKAMDKDRNRRYPSASELAADIGRFLRDEPVLAGPPSATYRMRKFARRHRIGVAAALLVTLVLTGSAITVSLQALRLRAALAEANAQRDRAEAVSGLLIDAFGEADPIGRTVDREVTAREVLERGAETLETQPVTDDVRAVLAVSMASAFLGLNDADKAEELADDALAASEADGGEPLASALIAKSSVLRHRSMFDEAIEYSQRAVGHADEAGLSARTRFRARDNLGRDLSQTGRYAEANAQLIEAQELAASEGGVDEAMVAELLAARAQNAYLRAEYDEAIELGSEAIERLSALSANPLQLLQASVAVANALSEVGRQDESLAWTEETYRIAADRLGEEHPTTRTHRNNFALRLQDNGQMERALALFEDAVAISRRVDPGGAEITYELNNLGLVQHGLNRLAEAEDTFREALRKQHALVGRDHPHPGFHLMNLGRVLQDGGRYTEAEQHYREAFELWKRLLPPDHTLNGNINVWYGTLLVETGRAADAQAMLEKGVAIREEKRGVEDWQTAEAQSWLGAALAELGDYERAEALMTDAYPVIVEQRGHDWRRTRWLLCRILSFYDLAGDQAGFERYAAEHRERYGSLQPIVPARRWAL